MISVDDALSLLDQHRPDWGAHLYTLTHSEGVITTDATILAQDITAPSDYPAQSVSIMDGYAFAKSDLSLPIKVIGESRAGVPFDSTLGPQEAVRIFTGAILPTGAQNVEIQENAHCVNNELSFTSLSTHRNYIRRAGADFKKGDRLFSKGTSITPAMILTLATCNIAQVKVKTLPRIAILSSGDELRPLGTALKPGQIVNSTGPALIALLKQWGLSVTNLGIASDSQTDIQARMERCDADIIVTLGGASVGDYDYMKSAAQAADFQSIFSKVAVKPGKPTWFSKKGSQYILGLPGNPSSAWVCAHIFLKYFIFGSHKIARAKLAKDIPENGSRELFLRGQQIENNEVMPLPKQDSGLVHPLSQADILIRLAPHQNLKAGDMTSCLKL